MNTKDTSAKENGPLARCASCPFQKNERLCCKPGGKHPGFCPTAKHPELLQKSLEVFDEPETKRFAQAAARTERKTYHRYDDGTLQPVRPRILEIVDFCKRMNYRRVGLIFCIGLAEEAAKVAKIFEAQDLEVVSAICKAGGVTKDALDLEKEALLCPDNPETMCNPVMQAMIMNDAKVDFNVLLGLCVGHDSLALKHLEAPATILAVKDRLLGHNPLANINCADSYFNYMRKPVEELDQEKIHAAGMSIYPGA